jgi:hypothetical protein
MKHMKTPSKKKTNHLPETFWNEQKPLNDVNDFLKYNANTNEVPGGKGTMLSYSLGFK